MKNKDEKRSQLKKAAELSGIGLQMGITIFLGAYAGKYLDGKYPMEKKWFTIGFTLLAVALSLYNVVRQLNQFNARNDKENS